MAKFIKRLIKTSYITKLAQMIFTILFEYFGVCLQSHMWLSTDCHLYLDSIAININ